MCIMGSYASLSICYSCEDFADDVVDPRINVSNRQTTDSESSGDYSLYVYTL